MQLDHLYDDVFQSMLDYLEYEEITRLSQTNDAVFVMCDDYVQHNVGVSVTDLYHFTDRETHTAPQLRNCRTTVVRPHRKKLKSMATQRSGMLPPFSINHHAT